MGLDAEHRHLVSLMPNSRDRLEGMLAAIADPAGEGARAFTKLYADEARAAADAADARARFGHRLSPIDGLVVSIKDLFDVAGETTRAGTIVYADAPRAEADAPIVARLRAAGAVIVGRTNMTELAFSGIGINPHYGTPGNPADRRRVPGGSSSGAAVAVADQFCDIAIGSDTGGSVRLPAAFCGVTGFKPTQARVPRDGAMPLSLSLDSVGPLAGTLSLCAATDSILAAEPQRDSGAKPIYHLVLAVARGPLLSGLDPQIERAFEAALSRLAKAGARIVDLDLTPLLAINDAIAAIGSITAVECADLHADVLATAPEKIDRRVVQRTRNFSSLTGAQFSRMLRLRAKAIAAATRAFLPFDAVVLPTCPIFAPVTAKLEADDDLFMRTNLLALRNTTHFNIFDCCGLSLPLADAGPLHAGFMMMGARGTDDRVIAAGLAVERVFGQARSPA